VSRKGELFSMSAYKSDYDRLLETVMREFEREVEQVVERKFAHVFAALQAGEEVEIPVIRRPEEYWERDDLQARVVRALCCRKWFEFEGPRWAQPLPLKEDDCIALFNLPEPRWGRHWLVGEYGRHLRRLGWHYQRAIPFEKFCAQKYNCGPAPTFGVRKRGRPRKLWAARY
jgi:hypothetical protein